MPTIASGASRTPRPIDTIARVRPYPGTPDRSSIDALRRWAVLLDSIFRVPGTNIRFGLDAILGVVPGLGDLVAPAFTVMVLLTGLHMRVPAVVQARMVLNAAIDMMIGLVPLLGDLADIAWKADLRNVALLERHARPGTKPSRGDYIFVFVCIGIVLVVAVAPVFFVFWLLSVFSSELSALSGAR
jgi:hypothetical protein